MIKELVQKNRSYRRYDENFKLTKDDLLQLIDIARLGASGANKQPLRYFLSYNFETNEKVFANISWAGYLPDFKHPKKGQQPTAYIVIVKNVNAGGTPEFDAGIACQNILLAATEKGLGGCIFASVNAKKLHKLLKLPSNYEIMLAIAIGKPIENVIIEDIKEGEDIRYWRDDKQNHFVPKIVSADLVIGLHQE